MLGAEAKDSSSLIRGLLRHTLGRLGFCLAGLLFVLGSTSALADALYMPLNSLDIAAQRAATIDCANNMRRILAAAHSWSMDNQDQPPPSLQVLTNELAGPQALFCPANLLAVAPTNWYQLDWMRIDC